MNEDMSRRGALSLLGAVLGLTTSALAPFEVEAQTATPAAPATPAEPAKPAGGGGTAGMKRRQGRRGTRHKRRETRRGGKPAAAPDEKPQ